jgi:hypothetical protein
VVKSDDQIAVKTACFWNFDGILGATKFPLSDL